MSEQFRYYCQSPEQLTPADYFKHREEISDNIHREHSLIEQDNISLFRARVIERFQDEDLINGNDHPWMAFRTELKVEPDAPDGLCKPKEILIVLDIAHNKSKIDYPLVRMFTQEQVGDALLTEEVIVDHQNCALYFSDAIITNQEDTASRYGQVSYGVIFYAQGHNLEFWNKLPYTPFLHVVGEIDGRKLLAVPFGLPSDPDGRDYGLFKANEILADVDEQTPVATSLPL